jgi:hypothetical protein
MPALTIHIPEAARLALEDLAETECRTPRDQAAFLVLQGLRAAAAAPATGPEPQAGPAPGSHAGPGRRRPPGPMSAGCDRA